MKAGKTQDPSQKSEQGKTSQEIAKAAGVSHDTVAKVPLLERRREIVAGMAKERKAHGMTAPGKTSWKIHPDVPTKPATPSPPRSEFQTPVQTPRPAILSKLLRML